MFSIKNKKKIVLVDAYSSGKYLIPAFISCGYPCVHIQSGFVPTRFGNDLAMAKQSCEENIIYDGNIETILSQLNEFNIKCILPGSEGGVELADRLNERLNMHFTNSIQHQQARRNKYLMQEALAAANIMSIKQMKVSTLNELESWFDIYNQFPFVIKPLKSAGSDGVHICHGKQQAYSAFNELIGTKDIYNERNDSILCQEFLQGTEYVVNGVACSGHYFITELWRSEKKIINGYPIYDTQYLSYSKDEHFKELKDYTCQVATALGIQNGAIHAEIMLTKRGPILIEVGARIAGSADPFVIHECIGHSQVSKLVEACLNPQQFISTLNLEFDRKDYFYAAYVFFIATKSGRVLSSPPKDFKDLEGFISLEYRYQPGDEQCLTQDLFSSPGVVMLLNQDKDKLQKTVKKCRELEAEFYDVLIANSK